MNELTAPVLSFSHDVFKRADDFFDVFFEFLSLREENNTLKTNISKLNLEVDRLHYLFDENKRLIELLDFSESIPWHTLPARVIGRAPSEWNRSLWINRGHKDGLLEGMAVVTSEGVVGKIVEIRNKSARVLLLIDESCKVGARVTESHELGIVEGTSTGTCVLKYLPQNAQTKSEDQVVTSGLSKFFPPGIRMGMIERIQDDAYGLFQYAKMIPNVNFGKLEEVVVIISIEKLDDDD